MKVIEENGNKSKSIKNTYFRNEKNEYINKGEDSLSKGMKGIDYLMFKYGIPEMLFENQDVIDRIIDGVKHKEAGTLPNDEMQED